MSTPRNVIGDELLFVPDQVVLTPGSLVGGVFVAGEGDEFEIVRPSDGQVAASERGATADQVDRAVRAARRSHATGVWADAPPRQRAQVFRRWADLVEANATEIVAVESLVSTRLATEVATRDIPVTVAIIRYYGEMIDKVEGEIYSSAHDTWSLGVREPYGVVACISPWNVPLLLATTKIAPALAAGNAVILKPSEFTPYSIKRVAQLAIEAGVPADHLAVLVGTGGQTGHALVTHPDVDYVSFTGSTATGRQVMSDAALSGPKPVSLEMGGKGPQIVFADADLDAASRIIASSVVRNAGQICYAGTRLVVDRTVADEMIDRIGRLVGDVVAGPTWSKATTLAPILSRKQRDRITAILGQGTARGAEILIGGAAIQDDGFYFEPTLVHNLAVDNPIVEQEVFGPVLAVQPFDSIDEALTLAEHCDYGLGAALYTRDLATAMRSSRSIKAGTVWVNQFGVNDIVAPVGGFKKSGFGKDFGMEGLLKYTHSKSISVKAFA
ncbi:aldehyde dehydrogenase family protein [Sphingomonas bacterium]|uniref:aldehyde dehydrogenase family protein n=1 Tax=Sphingomonas bacterium TaxID=1895847 RepID=UPI0015766B0E|nr:aldehyde dehydrogenase family protein [Sphingomonas bacterium]